MNIDYPYPQILTFNPIPLDKVYFNLSDKEIVAPIIIKVRFRYPLSIPINLIFESESNDGFTLSEILYKITGSFVQMKINGSMMFLYKLQVVDTVDKIPIFEMDIDKQEI